MITEHIEIEHISNKRSVVSFRVPESYEIMSNYLHCDKTKKEIQKKLLTLVQQKRNI